MERHRDSTHPSSPCELFPACKEGDHGSYQTSDGHHHAAKPIGKYHFTEDALKHDLHALKRGEIYERNEFYKRAGAWYKAEIDRLLHLETIREENESQQPYSPTSPPTANDANPLYSLSPATIRSRSGSPALAKEPTRRVQPSRAAKRKHLEEQQKALPPRKKRPAASGSSPNSSHGDYTLAAYDWAQFQNHNAGEHTPSPWSHIQFQGLDVAYFSVRLERAVHAKVFSLIESGFLHRRSTFWCLLETPKYRRKVPRVAVFEPAASLSPGEDWRPPPAPSSSLVPLPHVMSSQQKDAEPATATATAAAAATPAGSEDEGEVWKSLVDTWGADEARKRRQSVLIAELELQKRKKEGTPAPEASMVISPTLGRWPGGGGGEALLGRRKRMPVEDLEKENVVEVSGLRFAVDLCASFQGREEFARFLML